MSDIEIVKIIKNLYFLFNLFFIFSFEFVLYVFFLDYYNFIERITSKLASINILYVKLFQAIALNNSIIDDKLNNKLLEFTDHAPWTNNDIQFYDLIEMTDKYNIILDNNFEQPSNSGMISLIFKGYIKKENKKVIIKLKRRNIENKLNEAIQGLTFLMYLLSFIPIINKYKITEVVNKNIEIILQQTNFHKEVENILKVQNNCKNLKYVKIPKVYSEVTENYSNIIMMEYIEGLKINQIIEEDYNDFAKQVLKFGIVTSIIHGVAHGDLHAGNILFIKDEEDKKYKHKIGVIDFGIIYEIESSYKEMLFNLLTQMFDVDPKESAIKLLNSGLIDPPNIFQKIPKEDYENIVNFTSEIINDTIYNSNNGNQIQIYKFIIQFNNYLNNSKIYKLGIKPSDNFVKTQLVLAMAHGVTLKLCNDNLITVVDKVINELFHINLII